MRGDFKVDEWVVQPQLHRIRKGKVEVRLEPKAVQVLLVLCRHAGDVVSKQELLDTVWPGIFVTENVLTSCISDLRKAFGEDARNPHIIETIPTRGYRLKPIVEALASEPERPVWSAGRWLWGIGIAAGVALVFVLVGPFGGSDPKMSPVEPTERPTVLIARLDNRTGDERLDGTLEVVLEGRLNDSGRVQVVSRSRVEDSLRLMRKSVDEPLTAKLAREVSLRDGDVDFVLTGQVDGLGSRYHVTLRLLDGQSHELLASNDLKTNTLEGLLPVADDQAFWLLGQLGIGVPSREGKPERVTTKSLEALSLFTRGVASYMGGVKPGSVQKNTEAAQLFEAAIRLDPEFASAHLMLAWSRVMIARADPQQAGALEIVFRPRLGSGTHIVTRPAWEAMQRAMETRKHASLVEQAFIQGCYLNWKDELRKAAPFYRLAAELQPEHRWAARNLRWLGITLRDPALWMEGTLALHRGRPLEWQGKLVRRMVEVAGDLEKSRTIRDRAAGLGQRRSDPVYLARGDGTAVDLRHESLAQLWAFDVWSLWLQARWLEAHTSLGHLERRVAELQAEGIEVANQGLAHYLAGLQIMLGRLADAQVTQKRYDLHYQDGNWASWISSPGLLLAFLEESPAPLGEHMPGLARMFFDRAYAGSSEVEDSSRDPVTRKLVSILQLSRPEARIDGLKGWLSGLALNRHHSVFAVRWVLARELAQQGREDEAVAVLEEVVADRNRTWVGGAVIWQKAALDLARFYLRQGRFEEAEPLLTELAEMLRFADADHPILRELERLRLTQVASKR